jgi:hypothetical protein
VSEHLRAVYELNASLAPFIPWPHLSQPGPIYPLNYSTPFIDEAFGVKKVENARRMVSFKKSEPGPFCYLTFKTVTDPSVL